MLCTFNILFYGDLFSTVAEDIRENDGLRGSKRGINDGLPNDKLICNWGGQKGPPCVEVDV